MPHADQTANIAKLHDGVVPASWLTGDTDYQKAAVIAALAWHTVKEPSDPELPACDLTHRESCIGIAESLMRGNEPDHTPFAQAAFRIWKEVTDPPPTDKEIATNANA